MKKLFLVAAGVLLSMVAMAQPGGFGGFQMPEVKLETSQQWKDVNYAGDDQAYHTCDIYLPQQQNERYPVVIHIYGSAWFSNNSKGAADLGTIVRTLLAAGYAVVCPNHRSSMDARWPAQLHDIKAVVRFVRGEAAKYKFDPSFVAVSGFSSGGHLASTTATTSGTRQETVGSVTIDLEGNVGNHTDQSSAVNAACDWSGPIDLTDMDCGEHMTMGDNSPEDVLLGSKLAQEPDKYRSLSATTYVDKNDPPVIIFHGEKDNVVPCCQGRKFFEVLKGAGVRTEATFEPEGGHGMGMYSEENLQKMVRFLQQSAGRKELQSRIVEEGGTGPYKAIMTEVPGLEAHTVFHPQDLSSFGKGKLLPVLVWGNGACTNSPWEHYKFLNEIASYGYLVVATGYIPMKEEPYRGPMSTTQQQIESIDWAYAQNSDPQSPYYNKIDVRQICAAGMSCGGLQTLYNCADPRISTLMICNSGLFNEMNAYQAVGGMPMPPKGKLSQIHCPVLYLLGGEPDIAYKNGMDDFHRLHHVPAFAANLPVGHGGTYREPHGGEFSVVARAWLDWQLKGDKKAAVWFTGKKPKLAQRKGWTLEQNDYSSRGTSQSSLTPTSPDGWLSLSPSDGGLRLCRGSQTVLEIPSLGMGTAVPAASGLSFTFVRPVKEDYTMLIGKRHHCTNEAREYTAALNDNVLLRVRLYNDGLVFRYEVKGLDNAQAPQEQTAFRIPEGTRRWIQHWTDGYEDFYPLATSSKDADPWPYFDRRNPHNRWGFPTLIEIPSTAQPLPAMTGRVGGGSPSTFALITESNLERNQSAASLISDGDLYRLVPDKNELRHTGDWHTPWRVVIAGSLANVVESTLPTDVCEPSRLTDTSWIQPGVVSWVYWAHNHGSNDYNIIKQYVDMAATLHLPYVLIDAEWDEMKDGKTIEDAVAYARSQGIRPLIWYNSSVGWINGAPGPKFRLNKPEDREKEFAWCERIGVAGVKIDFFSGDTQENMAYCIDLLECAARHHLLVNFHGAPIPRGWQRTYPNLLSTEGVYGAEWYNNTPAFTNRAARHNATLPFTRNVIGPMDYTPCAFSDSQHPHITTDAHELALTVLFESGLQHLADRPESFLAQPAAVQQFLSQLPSTWDETRLLDGYPGEFVIMARRSGQTWYIAGINGSDEAREITLRKDINAVLGIRYSSPVTLFLDAAPVPDDRLVHFAISESETLPQTVTCQPRGGFVFVAR